MIGIRIAQTVQELLASARTHLDPISESPSLDAQVLLAEAMGRSRAWLLAAGESSPTPQQRLKFDQAVERRATGEPLPYVLGWWEFYGRRFRVTPDVLIPRPETERMIELALECHLEGRTLLDLGTGSGCIAVSLALELPGARVVASDISRRAIRIARENAALHDARVEFVQSSLLDTFAGPFDVICANLPYIDSVQLSELPVARHEPQLALDGGHDGMSLLAPAIRNLARVLRPDGLALFEIDPSQAPAVRRAARSVEILPDLSGKSRIAAIRR